MQDSSSRNSSEPPTLYLDQVTRRPLLRAEQEVELAKWIEAGVLAREKLDITSGIERTELEEVRRRGELAYQQMHEANLGLVVSIARRYVGRGLDLADLIQEGNLGLMTAIAKFDFTRGVKFSTFAAWWIRQALTVAMRTKSRLIRLPSVVHADEVRLRMAATKLALQLNREPTNREISEKLSISESEIIRLRELGRTPISIHSSLPDRQVTIEEILIDEAELSPPQLFAINETRQALSSALANLTADERTIIELRYGMISQRPLSHSAIAKTLGMNRKKVASLEASALMKLRADLTNVA